VSETRVARTILLLLLAAFVATRADVARAQQTPGANGAESPEYKHAVDAALEEYRLQHFDEARSLFERAHAIDPNARTLRGLGMVEFERRHYVRAAELLEAALKSDRKPLTAEQRKTVEELLSRTRQFISRYAVEVEPKLDAPLSVELDGKPVALGADSRLSLEAGEHTLRISAPDAVPQELHIDVKGGEEQTLRIELQVKTASAPAPKAVPVQGPPAARKRDVLGIALTGSGAAVGVAGGALGAIALLKAGDAKSRNDANADKAHAFAIGADVMLGVGIATAVTGVVLLLVHRSRRADTRGHDRADRSARVHVDTTFPELRVSF
jgi:tetratricopeptide (TPR) repeat protein